MDHQQDRKALDQLFYDVGHYRTGTDFKELLDFIRRFPKIAPFNLLLLYIQKPGTEYVATAREWFDKFKRTIKAGARPLVILRAFGPVDFVFELGDTEGVEFPEYLLSPFKPEGKILQKYFAQIKKNLPMDGILFAEANHGTGSAGYIQKNNKNKTQVIRNKSANIFYNLIVNQNHSDEEKFATIAHELGHLFCGHLGPANNWWPERSSLGKQEKEFEAESVAWLICERVGLKNPSADYLSGYLEDNSKIPAVSPEAIFKATGMIEARMKAMVKIRKGVLSKENGFN